MVRSADRQQKLFGRDLIWIRDRAGNIWKCSVGVAMARWYLRDCGPLHGSCRRRSDAACMKSAVDTTVMQLNQKKWGGDA